MNSTKNIFINVTFSFMVVSLFLNFPIFDKREARAQQGDARIQGAVKTPWVRRYPALVYVEQMDGNFPPPAEPVHISQKNMVFDPRINPILLGTTVDFTNDDTVVHNVFTPPGSAQRFNTGNYGVGVTKAIAFDKPGESTLLCSVHPEMLAYVLVLQNPYYALTDKTGHFEIKNVPSGRYKLTVWHEKLKPISKEIVVEERKTTSVEFKKKEFKKR